MMNYRFKWVLLSLCLWLLIGTAYTQDAPLSDILQRASNYVQLSDYTKADRLYSFYLRFQPNNIYALSQRAVVRASTGNFADAYLDIERAFAAVGFSGKEQAVIYNNRAQVYFLDGQQSQALDDFSRAIALQPTYADYWLNRGMLNQVMGQLTPALADYEQYLLLNPTDSEVYVNIARIRLALDDLSATLLALDQAIDLSPDDPELYIFRGSIHLLAQQFVRAANDYSDWLELINNNQFDLPLITGDTDVERRHLEMSYGTLYRIPFEAEGGDRLGLLANSRFVDSLVIILDPDGNPIMADDDSGQGLNAFIIDFTLPQNGTYTLLVGHARGGWEGTIQLIMQFIRSAGI